MPILREISVYRKYHENKHLFFFEQALSNTSQMFVNFTYTKLHFAKYYKYCVYCVCVMYLTLSLCIELRRQVQVSFLYLHLFLSLLFANENVKLASLFLCLCLFFLSWECWNYKCILLHGCLYKIAVNPNFCPYACKTSIFF